MDSFLANYLYSNDPPFIIFGLSHIVGLVIAILLAVYLPLYAKRHLTERKQNLIGSTLGWLVAGAYLSWAVLEMFAGTFSVKLHLPFHLCRAANLMLPFVMMKKSYRAYEILYFWGLSAMFQASLSPDIYAGFPHYHFIRFWLAHNLMVVAIIYATVVYGMRPTWQSLWRAFGALIIFFLVTIPVNLILDANYFWILKKPPTASLLDYFGPWPWYLLTTTFFALVHFYLVYLPFQLRDKGIRFVRQ